MVGSHGPAWKGTDIVQVVLDRSSLKLIVVFGTLASQTQDCGGNAALPLFFSRPQTQPELADVNADDVQGGTSCPFGQLSLRVAVVCAIQTVTQTSCVHVVQFQ